MADVRYFSKSQADLVFVKGEISLSGSFKDDSQVLVIILGGGLHVVSFSVH